MNKFVFNHYCNKLERTCNIQCSPRSSLADRLAFFIILTPHVLHNKKHIMNNKYVKADAALLLIVISSVLIQKLGLGAIGHSMIYSELLNKIKKGISVFYKIESEELNRIEKNRLKLFDKIYRKESFECFINEAALLFSYDCYYNKYVEFSKESPLLILDFTEQLKIEKQTSDYFNTVIPQLCNIVADYSVKLS